MLQDCGAYRSIFCLVVHVFTSIVALFFYLTIFVVVYLLILFIFENIFYFYVHPTAGGTRSTACLLVVERDCAASSSKNRS